MSGTSPLQRVFCVTDRPVDLHRAPDPHAHRGHGTSFGGTFVTEKDLTDALALAMHMQQNVPPLAGPAYFLTEIEAPFVELNPDPTISNPPAGTFWIPPSASAARIVNAWEIIEVHDPAGVRLIYRLLATTGS